MNPLSPLASADKRVFNAPRPPVMGLAGLQQAPLLAEFSPLPDLTDQVTSFAHVQPAFGLFDADLVESGDYNADAVNDNRGSVRSVWE